MNILAKFVSLLYCFYQRQGIEIAMNLGVYSENGGTRAHLQKIRDWNAVVQVMTQT